VVAVFHRPVPARRLDRTLLFVHSEAEGKCGRLGDPALPGGRWVRSGWTGDRSPAGGAPGLGAVGSGDAGLQGGRSGCGGVQRGA
jgi:hypothetical protein